MSRCRYDVSSLRRFAFTKREAIVLCFVHAARAETTDEAVEMQDELITGVYNKARQRYEELRVRAGRPAAVPLKFWRNSEPSFLDDSVANAGLQRSSPDCRAPRLAVSWTAAAHCASNEGSHLGEIHHWYGYTQKYSPTLIEQTPFQFAESSPIGRAVVYMKERG